MHHLEKILRENKLSTRECEVAFQVISGKSNRDVASALYVTEKTIKFHLTSIYKKLKVKSRTQLIVWSAPYHQGDLLPPEPHQIGRGPTLPQGF